MENNKDTVYKANGGAPGLGAGDTVPAAVAANPTQKKKRIAAAVAALLVVAGLVAAYFLLPGGGQTVLAGDNIVVTVTADALEDVYGYQFELNYDSGAMEFVGDTGRFSKLDEISMIFSKDFGEYELVGATMTGEVPGVSGKNKAVCEMVFTAKLNGNLTDFTVEINNVNVVQSDLEYLEGVEGWNYKTSVQKAVEA